MPGRISYKMLEPIRTLRREFSLTPSDLTVLTALISFLPREDPANPTRSPFLSVVFPSNAALSERTNGLDERTLRRCLGRLSEVGLIECRRSANGKRFPLRYGGKIRDAFGFDLSPIADRHHELARRAAAVTEVQERLRSLRAEALALRQEALQQTADAPTLARLHEARNLLRRASLSVPDVIDLIDELRQIIDPDTDSRNVQTIDIHIPEYATETSRSTSSETDNLPARDGQNVRHIESSKIDIKKEVPSPEETTIHSSTHQSMKRNPEKMNWQDFSGVASFYPTPPRSIEALTRIIFELGNAMNVRTNRLIEYMKRSGPSRTLLALDCLITRVDTIRHPSAYLDRILSVEVSQSTT
ncbi:MAG: replication protein C [Loktanella sp.]|nr:replication protein C [Loktanella sp.]